MYMTVCLSMIVKNEAHCIAKCLESVKPFIDYWIICDTGSTDNTKQIINQVLYDIPGEIHDHEWVDFSTNRNKSLELARKHADYILVIDADDYLHVEFEDIFNRLVNPAYNISIAHGNIVYKRIQLFKSNISARYEGIIHEYLNCYGIVPADLPGCYIEYGAKGSRSSDPNKYMKDALLLEQAIIKDPNNSRYVFYAAQSYRDAGRLSSALDLYIRRSAMGGWIEEQYISLLESAKIMDILFPNDIHHVEEIYLSAYNLIPTRIESLVYLSASCRRRKMYNKAYFYASIGSKISMPDSALFLEPSCYTWKIFDELAISSYYVGKKEESKILNIALIESNLLPINHLERVKNNLKLAQ